MKAVKVIELALKDLDQVGPVVPAREPFSDRICSSSRIFPERLRARRDTPTPLPTDGPMSVRNGPSTMDFDA